MKIEEVSIDVVMNGKKAQMSLKQLSKRLGIIEKTGKKATNQFANFGKKLVAFAGFAGFSKMAIDAAKLGHQLGLMSSKTGIASGRLSEMRSAFAGMGGDAKDFDKVIGNISSKLARLSMGDATIQSQLGAMGLSAYDEFGKRKTADVVLGDIADWAKSQRDMGGSIPEVSEYLRSEFNIPQEMANLLMLGRSGYEQAMKESADKVGSLSDKQIKALDGLNQSVSELWTFLKNNLLSTIADFAPAIRDFIKEVRNTLTPLLEKFRGLTQWIMGELGYKGSAEVAEQAVKSLAKVDEEQKAGKITEEDANERREAIRKINQYVADKDKYRKLIRKMYNPLEDILTEEEIDWIQNFERERAGRVKLKLNDGIIRIDDGENLDKEQFDNRINNVSQVNNFTINAYGASPEETGNAVESVASNVTGNLLPLSVTGGQYV